MRMTAVMGCVSCSMGVVTKVVSVRIVIVYALDVIPGMTIPEISMIVDLVMMCMARRVVVGVMSVWL